MQNFNVSLEEEGECFSDSRLYGAWSQPPATRRPGAMVFLQPQGQWMLGRCS